MIYFDNSATTFPDEEILEIFMQTMREVVGNPSSSHILGQMACFQLESARKMAADSLLVLPEEIIFTSSGTESNNMAIKGLARKRKSQGNHIITSQVEHASVHKTCRQLEEEGFLVTYLPVDQWGRVSCEDVQSAIRPETILASVMHVNSELGTVQPIKEIGKLLLSYPNIAFHVDTVQSFGKIPIEISEWGIDLLSLSSHKFHSPRGTGLLFVREGIELAQLLVGGGQEGDRRSGTENVASITAMCTAMSKQMKQLDANFSYLSDLKEYFVRGLRYIPNCIINSPLCETGAPHIVNFSIKGVPSEEMIWQLEERGILVSKSSACSSKSKEPSRVLTAIGISKELAQSAIRVSFCKHNTLEEIEIFLTTLIQIVTEKVIEDGVM